MLYRDLSGLYMDNCVSKGWMVAAIVLGITAAGNGGLAYVQHRALAVQLSAANNEVSLSHDEIANLKAKVRSLQTHVSSTPR